MQYQLFQYAVLLRPTKDEQDAGKLPVVIVEPAFVVAKDIQQANIIAARKIPEQYIDKLDRIDLAVSSF